MSSADLDSLDRNIGKQMGLNRDYYAGITQGRIEERERIIKLLEKYAENTDYPEVEWTLENLKEAIKGEQK